MHLSWILGTLIALYIIFLLIAWIMDLIIVWGNVDTTNNTYIVVANVFATLSTVCLIFLIIVMAINVIMINTVGMKYRERFWETEGEIFPDRKGTLCDGSMVLKNGDN